MAKRFIRSSMPGEPFRIAMLREHQHRMTVQKQIDVWTRKWRKIKERDRKKWERIHGKMG